jgi:hypothetical protein
MELWQREAKRVEYVRRRWHIRDETEKKRRAEQEKAEQMELVKKDTKKRDDVSFQSLMSKLKEFNI